jgi:cytochrome c-type biogenesis protein CcmH/NrfG
MELYSGVIELPNGDARNAGGETAFAVPAGRLAEARDMIRMMTKSSVPLLLAGFLAGFAVMYAALGDRDLGPIVIRDPTLLSPTRTATPTERDLLTQLESRLAGDPGDLDILTDLANLNWDIEDYAQAVVWYRRALEIAPFNPDLRTDLGTALFYENRIDEAIREFEQALAISPNHPQALINMGIVLLDARGDRDGALELWEQFLETNPAHARAPMIREEIENLRGGV